MFDIKTVLEEQLALLSERQKNCDDSVAVEISRQIVQCAMNLERVQGEKTISEK